MSINIFSISVVFIGFRFSIFKRVLCKKIKGLNIYNIKKYLFH